MSKLSAKQTENVTKIIPSGKLPTLRGNEAIPEEREHSNSSLQSSLSEESVEGADAASFVTSLATRTSAGKSPKCIPQQSIPSLDAQPASPPVSINRADAGAHDSVIISTRTDTENDNALFLTNSPESTLPAGSGLPEGAVVPQASKSNDFSPRSQPGDNALFLLGLTVGADVDQRKSHDMQA